MIKQFTVEKKTLLNLLSSMQPLCTKRTTIDATTSILFHVGHKELVLKSTDLEVSLQSSCVLEDSTLSESKDFLVSGRRIFDVIKELEGLITFKIEDNKLAIKAQGVNLSLNIKNAEEFPPFPERIENLMHIEAKPLLGMLESVAFLIPQNNSNPALNGLFLEIGKSGLTMTSTDGHCLAQVRSENYNLNEDRTWLLPRRAVFELKKILENSHDTAVFLGTCDNQLVFSGELFNFFTKLLVNPFPDYRPIMNKQSFVPAQVDRSQLVKTLRRSACLLSGQFLATRFTFKPNNLNVSLHNKEVGSLDEEILLKNFSADDMEVRFYTPYLLNGLQTFDSEEVEFYLKNGTRPIIFESKKNDLAVTYLVMPVSQTNQPQ